MRSVFLCWAIAILVVRSEILANSRKLNTQLFTECHTIPAGGHFSPFLHNSFGSTIAFINDVIKSPIEFYATEGLLYRHAAQLTLDRRKKLASVMKKEGEDNKSANDNDRLVIRTECLSFHMKNSFLILGDNSRLRVENI